MSTETILRLIRARAIPLRGDEIDTDRIIPARYLRCVVFDGLGQYAFQDERFDKDGKPKSHPFNDARYAGAGVLIVNRNFGCGSSREHAPQALARWGIKAIIGESFADIFAGNCAAIGLPAVTAAAPEVARLQELAESGTLEVAVDLDAMTATAADAVIPIALTAARRADFLAGSWDTTAALKANAASVSEAAARIPYLNGFR